MPTVFLLCITLLYLFEMQGISAFSRAGNLKLSNVIDVTQLILNLSLFFLTIMVAKVCSRRSSEHLFYKELFPLHSDKLSFFLLVLSLSPFLSYEGYFLVRVWQELMDMPWSMTQ